MISRGVTSLFGAVALLISLAGAHAESTVEHLSVPGPLAFHGESFTLSWSSHPTPDLYKQEYLPSGQISDHYTAMVLVDANLGSDNPRDAAGKMINTLVARKANDPLVNFSVIQNKTTDEVILDFIVSSPDADIVEWNGYRYAEWKGKDGKTGVVLFGISRRAYGDDQTAFLAALKAARPADLDALAALEMPAAVLKE
jgi:hypothetical protein